MVNEAEAGDSSSERRLDMELRKSSLFCSLESVCQHMEIKQAFFLIVLK